MTENMRAFRITFHSIVRKHIPELLEEFTGTIEATELKEISNAEFRSSSAWCHELSGYNEHAQKKQPRYSTYPPIICKDVEPGRDPVEGYFRTDIVRKVNRMQPKRNAKILIFF
jgi:hypothetical protein